MKPSPAAIETEVKITMASLLAFRCERILSPSLTRFVLAESKTSASLLSSRNISGKKSSLEPEDKVTHTGQKWDENDYRLVRFVQTPKQINERFAIDLIDSVPPKPIKDRHVWCNGGGGPLGHPKVYINLDPPGNHACGYCGLRYVQDKSH